LFKWFKWCRKLNRPDVIPNFITSDTLLTGTVTILSTKEVLITRWMVHAVSVLQLSGFVVPLGVGLGILQKIVSPAPRYSNFGMIRIGRIEPFGESIPFDFWLYYFQWLITWLLNVVHCLGLTNVYHRAEYPGSDPRANVRASAALAKFVNPSACVIALAVANLSTFWPWGCIRVRNRLTNSIGFGCGIDRPAGLVTCKGGGRGQIIITSVE
jgi:hypothetical protein